MKSPRILLVEDNRSTRALIEGILDLEGYDVVAVTDGESALRELTAQPPTLVILDIMLPDLDGLSVLREIRAAEATSEVPVIMLTALDDPDTTWQGWKGGCNYYLTKPFDTEDLLAVVGTLAREAA